jgi:hypothetical protein
VLVSPSCRVDKSHVWEEGLGQSQKRALGLAPSFFLLPLAFWSEELSSSHESSDRRYTDSDPG